MEKREGGDGGAGEGEEEEVDSTAVPQSVLDSSTVAMAPRSRGSNELSGI